MKQAAIKGLLGAAALVWSILPPGAAMAKDYPGDQPVRIIVGAPPGGGGDTVARIVAEQFGKQLGTDIIVENRPGAGGNIGTAVVARSAPDGYTYYFAYPSLVINPAVMASMPFDTKNDLRSVGKIANNQSVLLVRPGLPIETFPDFLKEVRANPGKYSFAGLQSSSQYIAGLQMAHQFGLDLLNVPYKGNSGAMNDLMGGQVDFMFNTVGIAAPSIEAGKVHALAVAGKQRTGLLPNVPTISEVSGQNFVAEGWYALIAPAGTPEAVIGKASDALQRSLADPGLVSKLKALGVDVDYQEPAKFDAFIESEVDRWIQVAKETNLSGGAAK
ncbi:MAG TPA: tripartite tricarboxylate transporter substrate-binding protein [Bordetella sp.]|nr:tripartite tricarboxylate transporter substrate-binding protein [Bordetella sp.]